jgi:hypothetical protein
LQLPGTRPTERMPTVDEHTIPPAGDPFTSRAIRRAAKLDDTIDVHYASLERACSCYGGYHYVGHMEIGEDGEEVEVIEAVPCRGATASLSSPGP